MDWYSWLSKTSLDQELVYEYGLVFNKNELQKEDLIYFNHEFLQSMDINVAKHRLEILKLARKEGAGGHGGGGGGGTTTTSSSNGLSRLVLAINKTKKLIAKNLSKLSLHRGSTHLALSELKPYRTQWTGALKKLESSKDQRQERAIITTRSMAMKSGPLDRRMQDKFMSASGPLDGRVQEKLMYPNRSPMKSGPLDRRYKDTAVYPSRINKSGPLDVKCFSPRLNHCCQEMIPADDGVVYSQWSLMFQDMKPT
ncbi:putative F-box protein-like [Capsicum annuum]|nr:putative F-box protein-like [Capsicum annuum]